MSKTKIPTKIKRELWFRAHGRCEFNGCNKRLDLNGITFDDCDLSNAAHIIADSPNGPRGDKEKSKELASDINNLMLMCPECHKYIDNEGKNKYDIDTLRRMKKEHEDRIEMLVNIAPNKKSLVVFYGAKVGLDDPLLNKSDAYEAILPDFYPSEANPIRIEMKNSVINDSKDIYWSVETEQLESKCNEEILRKYNETSHISLFALAPQPLLVKLGTLLNDKYNVEVFQKHREPSTWKWLDESDNNSIQIIEPEEKVKIPVLIFAISSSNIISRVQQTLNDNYSVWVVTCKKPNNDMLKSRNQLEEFRQKARFVIDKINTNAKGKDLHIFMAMPAALAVELGRIRMKKADIPWILHDYQIEKGSDIETIKIS